MLNLKPPQNPNYAATVVELKHFVPLAGCDNVQAALIFGNQVIVGKDAQPGDVGLYFPVEVALSREFLAANNLYRKPEWGNVDPAKTGFFEESGRVKCVKFRGHRSEGFYIPLSSLSYLGTELPPLGAEFDELAGHPICQKYVPARNPGRLYSAAPRPKRADVILPGQFAYHIDTAKLDRNIHKLQPTDIISITEKWHGTSAIFAHVLVERPLKWYEKLLVRMGVNIARTEYAHVWASRRVIKGVGGQAREGVVHYYKSDIWGDVFAEVKELIPKGYTLYGEIVGWTADGAPIQSSYTYGCPTGGHKFVVYRITYTNPEGVVLNLSWPQIREFCNSRGIETVKEVYYGYAQEMFSMKPSHHESIRDFSRTRGMEPDSPPDDVWRYYFMEMLKSRFVEDRPCSHNPGMPAEGVVLRRESAQEFEAYKCKSFAFLANETKQLDKGTVDMETLEAENVLEEEK